jgi:undecaprenyl diphosphate synthase
MTMNIDAASTIPMHLGLILDGNRRWAKAQGLPTLEGHRAGYGNLKTIGKAAIERGVKYVSAYVFSTENWNRTEEEVSYLMKLLLWVAKNEVEELHKENIRVRFLGSEERLSPQVLKAIKNAEEKTKNNTAGTLALCLNYGGHQEIVDATRRMVADGLKADQITKEVLEKHLYTPDIPPLDLIIRTSGEQRISNFMLWRAAYSELLFVNKHWPAFTVDDLDAALAEYASRQRRFGH